MENNICFFIPKDKKTQTLNVINFVLETKPQTLVKNTINPYYKAVFVRSGDGTLYTANKTIKIKSGDLFFTFAGSEHTIIPNENLTYIYVSFLGPKGNQLLERANISRNNFYFENCKNLRHFWEEAIYFSDSARTSASEGLLLYTFAFLENKIKNTNEENKNNPIIDKIIKLAEENIANSNFSLDTIFKTLGYTHTLNNAMNLNNILQCLIIRKEANRK